MTELQLKLLEYYKTYRKTNKTHPTVQLVADYFGVTRQTIQARIKSLVNKGYLTKVYDGAFVHTAKR